jgi:hypothetical protein
MLLPLILTTSPPRLASPRRRRYLLVSAASSSAINGGGDHYTLLGVTRSANAVEIKRAYRLLARKVFQLSSRFFIFDYMVAI